MMPLLVGLLVFFAAHLIPTQREIRAGLTARFGEGAYKGAFAILSLIGLTLVVLGWAKLQLHPEKNVFFGEPPIWTRHLAVALMLPAMILLVAAYVPSRIRTAMKHPFLVAIKIWALAHLLVNWDLASFVLFGSFLAYAVFDRISVKKRGAAGPLGLRTGGLAGDLTAIAGGTALYLAILLWAHRALIGVAPLPISP